MPLFTSTLRQNNHGNADDFISEVLAPLSGQNLTTSENENAMVPSFSPSTESISSRQQQQQFPVVTQPSQLPFDLIARILRFCPFQTIQQFRLVSKTCYEACNRNAPVMRQLELCENDTKNRNEFDLWMHGEILSLNHVRHLRIRNTFCLDTLYLQVAFGMIGRDTEHDANTGGDNTSSLPPPPPHLNPRKYIQRLHHLDLSGCGKVRDNDIVMILEATGATLHRLILDRCDGLFGTFICDQRNKAMETTTPADDDILLELDIPNGRQQDATTLADNTPAGLGENVSDGTENTTAASPSTTTTDDCRTPLATLAPNLQELSISRCFSIRGFKATRLPCALRIFRASRLGCIDNAFFTELLVHLEHIEALDLSYCYHIFPSRSSWMLTNEEVFPSTVTLNAINLSKCFFETLFSSQLLQQKKQQLMLFPNLTRLIVNNTEDLNTLMKGLLNFISCHDQGNGRNSCQLEYLDLSIPTKKDVKITFSRAARNVHPTPPMEPSDCTLDEINREVFVSSLKKLPHLRVLVLLGWKFNHNTLYILSSPSICPSLESLSIGSVMESGSKRSFSLLFESESLRAIRIEKMTKSELVQCKEVARYSQNSLVTVRVDASLCEYTDTFNALNFPFESFPYPGILVRIKRIIDPSRDRLKREESFSLSSSRSNSSRSLKHSPSSGRQNKKKCIVS